MLNAKVYCQEILDAIERAFERRRFVFEHDSNPRESEDEVMRKVRILVDGRHAGSFLLHYKRIVRRLKMPDGTRRPTWHPIRYGLFLQVTIPNGFREDIEVCHKTHAFYRGIPGMAAGALRDAHGRRCMGRPKVRKWATYASKLLLEKHVFEQAEFIHDQ